MAQKPIDLAATRRALWRLLKPEGDFLWVIVIYGLAISLLTLAVPIAVQTLINTIANIGQTNPVLILAAVLFGILVAAGLLSALRMWVVERYERRLYARLVGEISYRVIRAQHQFFAGRRNAGITDRYFDIMIMQKNVPRLAVDGFALALQIVVGFTLVSFYHPSLFIFNLLVLSAIYLIWLVWARGAKRTAIELSKEKYQTAKWLNDLEFAHEFFKSRNHVSFAAKTTDHRAARFIDRHAAHFRFVFSQAIGFLLLYALGSASLLGLGGWLVAIGQLSVGQLVAAELIMASIFLGLSRFPIYLKAYYELLGAADKLTELLSVPQEPEHARPAKRPHNGELIINGVTLSRGDQHCRVDMHVADGTKALVEANEAWVQRQFVALIKRHFNPAAGSVLLSGVALSDLDPFDLRQAVYSIDRSLIIECTIEEYFQLGAPEAGQAEMIDALDKVGLWSTVSNLPKQLATHLSALGAPLQGIEVMLLKVAIALVAKPTVLILNQRFDALSDEARRRLMTLLSAQPFTVLYFTRRSKDDLFEDVIKLEATTVATKTTTGEDAEEGGSGYE